MLGLFWSPVTKAFNFNLNQSRRCNLHKGWTSQQRCKHLRPVGNGTDFDREVENQGSRDREKGLVADEDLSLLKRWFDTVHQLNNINVPRCLLPNDIDIVKPEFHTFGDAPKEAYSESCLRAMFTKTIALSFDRFKRQPNWLRKRLYRFHSWSLMQLYPQRP